MSRHWHVQLMEVADRAEEADRDFDTHALACAFAVALDEAATRGLGCCEATGLDPTTIEILLVTRFSSVERSLLLDTRTAPPRREVEEEMLHELLLAHAAPTGLAGVFARLIARRAMRPDHLWQDLGLFDRSELGRLLARHFPTLHAGNTGNMRWKKYFYRRLCEAEGFSLCSAPSCAQCTDFHDCFGSEDGESRMAERRRDLDRAVAAE
jgi:nitrogen fixation protein NifQ